MSDKIVNVNRNYESWINSRWRPMLAWSYFIICGFDFLVAPIGWAILQSILHTFPIKQWEPITLQGAGLYHLSMGAILGLSAWSRGQEKIMGMSTGNYRTPYSTTRSTQTMSVTRLTDTDNEDADLLIGRMR